MYEARRLESLNFVSAVVLVVYNHSFRPRYTSTGDFLEELPELNEARLGVACSSFEDQNGEIVSWIFYIYVK